MPQFVRLLTAFSILVHATVGCCAHEACEMLGQDCEHLVGHDIHECHGHACESENQSACSSSLGQSSDHDEYPQQGAPHECSHADCEWPIPEVRTSVDQMLLCLTGSAPQAISAPLVILLGDGHATLVLTPTLSPHTAPLRAHLAKCVLLI